MLLSADVHVDMLHAACTGLASPDASRRGTDDVSALLELQAGVQQALLHSTIGMALHQACTPHR
jgi:hypothetical protein